MVNNQIEFNTKYTDKSITAIEIKRNRNFQGELVIEEYSNLEKLNLRDIKNIDKINLKNLPQLQEVTIWNCGLQNLAIENCPQIKKLNLRRNLLTNLNFIKDLNALETLELDGNSQLTELLEPYEDDWKEYQKDLQSSNGDSQELLAKIKILEKENEFLNTKYDELKKFVKEILVSLSQEEKKELSTEIDKKTQRKSSLTAPGMTKELILNTEKVIKSWKEIRKDLENELFLSKAKAQELEQKLSEQISLYQEKEIELRIKEKESDKLLDKLLEKSVEKEQITDKGEKENLQKEISILKKNLDETKEREFELKGELKAKGEEIERMNKTIEKAIEVPKTQNVWQNNVVGSQNINTYQAQFNIQYQQLTKEIAQQITQSLANTEITPQDQKIINQTILFLGTKELFINYRQQIVNQLIETYCKFADKKYTRFAKTANLMEITSKIASAIPGGKVASAPIGIIGDIASFTGTLIQERDLKKCIKEFQEVLKQDQENLALFHVGYQSLTQAIWPSNSHNNQGEVTKNIIDTLQLKNIDQRTFYDKHRIQEWKLGSDNSEQLKDFVIELDNNLKNIRTEFQDQRNQLIEQSWFKVVEEKTDLLRERQALVEIPNK